MKLQQTVGEDGKTLLPLLGFAAQYHTSFLSELPWNPAAASGYGVSTVEMSEKLNGLLRSECEPKRALESDAARWPKLRDDAPTHNNANSIAESMSKICLLYTSPSPRDHPRSRMPSCA